MLFSPRGKEMRENKTHMTYLSQPLNALKAYRCHCGEGSIEKLNMVLRKKM